MKSICHRQLGKALASHYLNGLTPAERTAFLLGCVEPDRNPATYLKGSLHGPILRGHSFPAARGTLLRLLARLESGVPSGALYYYRLGKLTHYIADAFTWPHNETFSGPLRAHMAYEAQLEPVFLDRLNSLAEVSVGMTHGTLRDWLLAAHQAYLAAEPGPETDCRFLLTVEKTAILRLLDVEMLPSAHVIMGGA